MGKILKYKGWNLLDTGYFPSEEMIELFNAIQSDNIEAKESLKNHHRSKVLRIQYKGKDLVVKTPLEKNQRHWIRFTTLFRSGEAFKNIKGMELLSARNIPSTEPVMAAECRRSGMVTDSWLVYEYLDGQPCFGHSEDLSDVVVCLQSMHNKGLLHGDSQLQNFLNVQGIIYVIDANPSPYWNSLQTAYEFAYLRKSWPEIESFFGPLATSLRYRIAREYLAFDRRLAHTRRRIKRFLGFKPREG